MTNKKFILLIAANIATITFVYLISVFICLEWRWWVWSVNGRVVFIFTNLICLLLLNVISWQVKKL